MNNFDYPLGSDDSDAPWNEEDGPMKECSACEGKGGQCRRCGTPLNQMLKERCCGVCLPSGTCEGWVACNVCLGEGEVEMTSDEIQDEINYRDELND